MGAVGAAAKGARQVASAETAEGVIRAVSDRRVRVKSVRQQSQYAPVITALTVIIAVRFLNAWIVDKRPLPKGREFFAVAILGFVLSLMSDLSPRVGKGFSYLILTAVVFGGTADIWNAIRDIEAKPDSDATAPGLQSDSPRLATTTTQRQTLFVNVLEPQRVPAILTPTNNERLS